jgi:hypothetical protein
LSALALTRHNSGSCRDHDKENRFSIWSMTGFKNWPEIWPEKLA